MDFPRTVRSVLLFVVCAFSAGAAADPYGDPFRANVSTAGDQAVAAVANGANGDSVLLWQDVARGDAWFVQRYNGAGQALQTEEWFVGSGVADVAVSGTGSYAVLRSAPDGSGNGVFVTVFNRGGTVVVPEFRVNDATAGNQFPFAIAMNANGQFAVMWIQPSAVSGAWDVFVKRFQANGAAVAPATLVRSTPSNMAGGDIAIDGQGNFVVVWDELASPFGNDFNVFARRYASTGFALSGVFRVNTFATGIQVSPRVTMGGNGAFVVTWTSLGQVAPNAWSVHAQRYSAAGALLGGEIRVSVQTSARQQGVAVATASNGSFVVTWNDDNRSIDPSALPRVYARTYGTDGVASGDAFVVSPAGDVIAQFPQVGMDPDGNTTIAWQHYDRATLQLDVLARRYMPVGVAAAPLANGQVVSDLSGAAGSWQYFKITVPAGQTELDVSIFGSLGDADLYVRLGAVPSLTQWDGRPFINGSNEAVRMLNWPPGDWYIGVNGFSAYSGLALRATSF